VIVSSVLISAFRVTILPMSLASSLKATVGLAVLTYSYNSTNSALSHVSNSPLSYQLYRSRSIVLLVTLQFSAIWSWVSPCLSPSCILGNRIRVCVESDNFRHLLIFQIGKLFSVVASSLASGGLASAPSTVGSGSPARTVSFGYSFLAHDFISLFFCG